MLQPSPKAKKDVSCCSRHISEHDECDMTSSIFLLMFHPNLVDRPLFFFPSVSLSLCLSVSLSLCLSVSLSLCLSVSLEASKIGSSFLARWDERMDNHPAAFFRSTNERKISMTSHEAKCEVKAFTRRKVYLDRISNLFFTFAFPLSFLFCRAISS